MPATAGRVRMPANNRVHSSAALQTHGIWQSAIGYDPYAPTNKDLDKGSARLGEDRAAAASENAYASFQGLLALARATGSGSNDARGTCKKCGRVGHLTFQCRNFLSTKDPPPPTRRRMMPPSRPLPLWPSSRSGSRTDSIMKAARRRKKKKKRRATVQTLMWILRSRRSLPCDSVRSQRRAPTTRGWKIPKRIR